MKIKTKTKRMRPAKAKDEPEAHARPGADPLQDTAEVMRFYGLRDGFPREAVEEAREAGARPADLRGRLDLRKEFVFTCDPESARDYDDAISLKPGRGGRATLGVHIADVSHFVKPDGALDREARRRSTSVYFADRVVPMLPESLSNGACSLVPGEDRLAFSVFIEFDREGRPVKRSFAKSVIRSKARYTYEQVMSAIASGGKSAAIPRREAKTVVAVHRLAEKLRAARIAAGALDIEFSELDLRLDGFGELESWTARPYDESHRMIEECMVAANEAVAAELWTKGIRILARLHEPPDPEKLETLRAEMASVGIRTGDISSRKAFSAFLASIKGHPLYPTLAMAVLRSMKRAVYDASSIGHFGLAKRFYAHFTSPIRRYPDLVLHRQLSEYVAGRNARIPAKTLAKWAKHASEAENTAAEAERSLAEIKKYRYLEHLCGMRHAPAFDATVSKCMPFGCFMEISDLGVSGLVHVSRLSRGYVRFDEATETLSASGRRTWRLGDRMAVRVARVDFAQRRVDLVPVER